MWTSLAFVAALGIAPGQGAGISLSNARVRYGELGAIRPDTKFIPANIYFLSFDIEGITVDEEGRVKYSMEMEVVNSKNQKIFKNDEMARAEFSPLGGNSLPARAYITLGSDQEPGSYLCRVKVTDLAKKASQTLEHKFEVIPKSFGVVRVFATADHDGKIPAPTLGVVGQTIFVHFSTVWFMRDPLKKQPDIEVEMILRGADGKPTVSKPTTITINRGVDETDIGTPLVFPLAMTRVGDYTIELKAVDKVGKQTSKVVLPVRVLPSSK